MTNIILFYFGCLIYGFIAFGFVYGYFFILNILCDKCNEFTIFVVSLVLYITLTVIVIAFSSIPIIMNNWLIVLPNDTSVLYVIGLAIFILFAHLASRTKEGERYLNRIKIM